MTKHLTVDQWYRLMIERGQQPVLAAFDGKTMQVVMYGRPVDLDRDSRL